MIETQTRQIDANVYHVRQLDGHTAYKTFFSLGKMLCPSVAAVAASVLRGGGVRDLLDKEIDGDFLVKAAQELVTRFDEAKVEHLIITFAKQTSVEMNGVNVELGGIFGTHFAGHLGSMFKWLAFSLEVNFADFLGDWATRAQTALATAAASSSPTTSAGPSGGS